MKDNNNGNIKLMIPHVIPRFRGASSADYILCALARAYPEPMFKDDIAKDAGVSTASVYNVTKELEEMHVLEPAGRNRFKLANLNAYIQKNKGAVSIGPLLKKHDIKLPPDVYSPEGIKTLAPMPVNNVQPINEAQVRKLGMSEAEGRLKDYVTGFVEDIRSKFDLFEANLEAKNY